MVFYKVKKEADNLPLFKKSGWYLIANELYTEKEISKISLTNNRNKFDFLDKIEISKFKTYKMFGARFEKTF